MRRETATFLLISAMALIVHIADWLLAGMPPGAGLALELWALCPYAVLFLLLGRSRGRRALRAAAATLLAGDLLVLAWDSTAAGSTAAVLRLWWPLWAMAALSLFMLYLRRRSE